MTAPHPIVALLHARRLAFGTEDELQRAIAIVLDEAVVTFKREVRLAPTQRIDFLLADGTGIEVKMDGSRAALIRQLFAYADSPFIHSLVVVTTLARLTDVPDTIGGKSVAVVHLVESCI